MRQIMNRSQMLPSSVVIAVPPKVHHELSTTEELWLYQVP